MPESHTQTCRSTSSHFPVWKDVFETNVDGMFLVTQAALGLMKNGGTIVNNLSIAATRVFAGSAAYNASKHAARGFTNTLREELRPRGIRVIGLASRRHGHGNLEDSLAPGTPP